MKMHGPSYFKYPWDIRPALTDDEQDTAATQPIASVDDDAALDEHIDALIAFGARLDAMDETENDDNGL